MIKSFNHFGLSVADIDLSIKFYRDLLGLRLIFHFYNEKNDGLSAVVGYPETVSRVALLDAGGTHRLELWQYISPRGRGLPPNHGPADHGFSHIAFEVDDVSAAHKALADAGFRANSKPINLGPHTACYVHGPDGEIIELLEDNGFDIAVMAEFMAEGGRAAYEMRDVPLLPKVK